MSIWLWAVYVMCFLVTVLASLSAVLIRKTTTAALADDIKGSGAKTSVGPEPSGTTSVAQDPLPQLPPPVEVKPEEVVAEAPVKPAVEEPSTALYPTVPQLYQTSNENARFRVRFE